MDPCLSRHRSEVRNGRSVVTGGKWQAVGLIYESLLTSKLVRQRKKKTRGQSHDSAKRQSYQVIEKCLTWRLTNNLVDGVNGERMRGHCRSSSAKMK
jgi:hypothetical protein